MHAELVTAFVLRCRLEELTTGVIALDEFDAWLTSAAWDNECIAPDASELVGHVRLLIDEYSGGAWTWPDLRTRLESAAGTVTVAWGAEPAVPRITTGTTNPVIRELDLVAQG